MQLVGKKRFADGPHIRVLRVQAVHEIGMMQIDLFRFCKETDPFPFFVQGHDKSGLVQVVKVKLQRIFPQADTFA